MQISALLLTVAAAAVANAQTNPDGTFPDTNAYGGPVTTDLTKCGEILPTTNYVAPEAFSAETCLQKYDCYDVNSVSQAVSDCDHCLTKAYQECPNTHGFSTEEMDTADRECVEESYKGCKPSDPLTYEAYKWELVAAPVEDEAGHRTGVSTEEGSTA